MRPIRWSPLDVGSDEHPFEGAGKRGVTSLAGLVLQGGLRLAMSVAVGRLAGPDALGIFSSGQAVAQMAVLFGPTTAGQAASRFLARARGQGDLHQGQAVGRQLAWIVLVSTCLLCVASAAIWSTMISPFSDSGVINVVALTGVPLLVLGLAGQAFTRGAHYAVGAVRRIVVLDIACSLVGLIGLVLLLRWGLVDRLLLAPALAYIFLAVLSWPRGLSGRPPRALRREVRQFVLFGTLGTIASAGLIQLSLLMARRGGGVEQAGQYAAAMSLATPMTLASAALSLVLFPSLAEAAGRGDASGIRRQLDLGFKGVLLSVVPAVGLVILLSEPVVAAIWGEQFSGSGPILPVLLVAVLVNAIGVPCVNALTGVLKNGIALVAAASYLGLIVACLYWWSQWQAFDSLKVAMGYALGVSVISGAAVAGAWMKWRPDWSWLVVRAVMLMLIAWLGADQLEGQRVWVHAGAGCLYVGLCLLLTGRDMLVVWRRVQNRTD